MRPRSLLTIGSLVTAAVLGGCQSEPTPRKAPPKAPLTVDSLVATRREQIDPWVPPAEPELDSAAKAKQDSIDAAAYAAERKRWAYIASRPTGDMLLPDDSGWTKYEGSASVQLRAHRPGRVRFQMSGVFPPSTNNCYLDSIAVGTFERSVYREPASGHLEACRMTIRIVGSTIEVVDDGGMCAARYCGFGAQFGGVFEIEKSPLRPDGGALISMRGIDDDFTRRTPWASGVPRLAEPAGPSKRGSGQRFRPPRSGPRPTADETTRPRHVQHGGRMSRTSFALGLAMVLASTTATAQEAKSNTTGVLIHANGAGVALSVTEGSTTETESGSGYGVALGWGFTPRWAVVLDGSRGEIAFTGNMGTYTLDQAFLAGRFHFNSQMSLFRPYVEAGIAGRGISTEVMGVQVDATGLGFGIGGGLQWYFTRTAAVDLGLRYITGSFSEWKANGQSVQVGSLDAVSTTVRVGLTWYPMANR